MTVNEIKKTDAFRSLPGPKSHLTKPQICQAINNLGVQGVKPNLPPLKNVGVQVTEVNCRGLTLEQLKSSYQYKQLSPKVKPLLVNKERICNAIFNPGQLHMPISPLNREQCEQMSTSDLRLTEEYKSLKNKKTLTNKYLICDALFNPNYPRYPEKSNISSPTVFIPSPSIISPIISQPFPSNLPRPGQVANFIAQKFNQLSSPTKISPTRISPTRISPTRVSPTRVSPTRISPTRVSPTRESPTRISPTRISPTREIPFENLFGDLPVIPVLKR
jgi:hypothetical protein